MKKLFVGICLLGLITSCGGGGKNPDAEGGPLNAKDSVEAVIDTLSLDEEVEESIIPMAVDESFADFLYNFAVDEKLQRSRIVFPLPYYMDKEGDYISKESWQHDPLFSQQEYYTMLYDTMDDAELEKNTTFTSVQIEWINLKSDKIKRYYFERKKGLWTLEAIDDASLPKEKAAQEDFYEFYERFAGDSLFQAERVINPLPFAAPDPEDEFQILETTLEREQWFAFQPKLSADFLTNINYGQRLDNRSRTRIVELRGFGNGFNNLLCFRCRNGIWKLVRFEDLSN